MAHNTMRLAQQAQEVHSRYRKIMSRCYEAMDGYIACWHENTTQDSAF